jgi:hypothetical protein
MKILLLGEYSSVHWTLAEGLRALGHDVTVISDGDSWKAYQADILLRRRNLSKVEGIRYLAQLLRHLPKLRGYDVVQIINPCFFDVKIERCLMFFRYLRRHNKRLFLGAYGDDYYWIDTCVNTDTFRYSDFRIFGEERHTDHTRRLIADWVGTAKEAGNRFMAEACDGIIAGLYEYYASYAPRFPDKTVYIPFPISRELIARNTAFETPAKVNFFLGIQRKRADVKGAEVLERALDRVAAARPEQCTATKAISVPYAQYKEMLLGADVLLDQIYSYTPAMNALLGMARGLVVVGGGEEEFYELTGEPTLRPIVNVLPCEEDIYQKLDALALHPERIPELKRQGVEFVKKYHDCVSVAQQYLQFWGSR